MTDRIHRCETCNSIVRIVSADNDIGGSAVTAHYEPMQDEELRAAIERLKEMNVELTASRNYWRQEYVALQKRIQRLAKWACPTGTSEL